MLGPATASSLGRARIWALVFTGQQYREMQTPLHQSYSIQCSLQKYQFKAQRKKIQGNREI